MDQTGARRMTLTLVEANGLRVLPIVLLPVVLTGIGLWASLAGNGSRKVQSWGIWGATVFLALYCLVGAWSVGLFYMPAGLALLVAAIIELGQSTAIVKASESPEAF